MATIKISKKITLTDDIRQRLRVWVSETSNNIPGRLFVYQHIPIVPMDTELANLFVHVASYADINDYPEEAPDTKSPFFRRSGFDLVFDSKAELELAWIRAYRMLQNIVEDISRLNSMDPVEIVVVDL